MSVINEMLQDLERRRYPAPERAASAQAVATSPVRKRAPGWLLGIISLCLLVGIGWIYATQIASKAAALSAPGASSSLFEEPLTPEPIESPPEEPKLPVVSKLDPISAVESLAEAATVSPPALNRIELKQRGPHLEIDLLFNQALEVPPLQYRQGDRLWLRLFHAQASRIELPELTDQMSIREWLAYVDQGYQMVSMRLGQDLEDTLEQKGSRHWRLILRQKPQPREVETRPNVSSPHESMNPSEARPLPAKVQQQPAAVPAKRKRDPYKSAEKAWTSGRRELAERLLKELLNQQPGHLQATLLLSGLHLAAQRPELAEPLILSALQRHPEQPELVSRFVRCLVAQQRLAEAQAYLTQTMQVDYAPHLGLLAVIRQRQGQHHEARDYYQQALNLKPDEASWLAGMGMAQEQLGAAEAARQAYRQALQTGDLDPVLQRYVDGRLSALNESGY